jgi:hypothetical protein
VIEGQPVFEQGGEQLQPSCTSRFRFYKPTRAERNAENLFIKSVLLSTIAAAQQGWQSNQAFNRAIR